MLVNLLLKTSVMSNLDCHRKAILLFYPDLRD